MNTLDVGRGDEFSHLLKIFLRESSLSQAKLSRLSGVTKSSLTSYLYSHWCTGKAAFKILDTIYKTYGENTTTSYFGKYVKEYKLKVTNPSAKDKLLDMLNSRIDDLSIDSTNKLLKLLEKELTTNIK